jgi:Myo-inositol-1-phosphate synthase
LENIRVAIIGIGNCASSLIQGIYYYVDKKPEEAIGLMHWEIEGYKPSDIDVVAAFDIDDRKVGMDVNEAIYAPPNCTTVFCPNIKPSGSKSGYGLCPRWCSSTHGRISERPHFCTFRRV